MAILSPFNLTDKDSQIVPHSRASHVFSDPFVVTNQNIESLCFLKHNKESICPSVSRNPDQEISPKTLSSTQMSQIPEIVVTLPIRSNTVRVSTVPRTVLSPTEMYHTVPGVPNTVQYSTPCNPDYVPITVPFSFVQGLKTSKRNNTHFKNKYKKKFSRTPLIVPRIIELSKDVDPHLDQRVAPLTAITMDLVVLELEALGGPTGTWRGAGSNPSNIKY